MRIPDSLTTLADLGIIEEVVRPLMSGKEAQVYLVVSGGEPRVAKIYKEAQDRSFKHRAEYTEGRKVRNTRDQRAISKRSSHGRAQDEAAWRATEVEMIYRLQRAGVRVPVPHHFIDGVLIMELITDAEGNPAPRLGDLALSGEAATAIQERLLREVVKMLCAGVVHGDLSDFNVLMAADGPVLIDFPQSVDAAHNQNARKLLLRDVDNLHAFLARFVRHARRLPYAEEMWDLYQSNALAPETVLSGRYRSAARVADTASVLGLIHGANRDERRRRDQLGLKGGPAVTTEPGADSGSGDEARNARPGPGPASRPNARPSSRANPDPANRQNPRPNPELANRQGAAPGGGHIGGAGARGNSAAPTPRQRPPAAEPLPASVAAPGADAAPRGRRRRRRKSRSRGGGSSIAGSPGRSDPPSGGSGGAPRG